MNGKAILLLGTANLVFWRFFVVADALAMGYVTTSLHWLFVALELGAAAAAGSRGADPKLVAV